MSILSRLFAPRRPAPVCEVDPEDHDLVTDSDVQWWQRHSLLDYELLARQDDIFKVALLMKFTHDKVPATEALERVRKAFPVYYLLRAERTAGVGFVGVDAKLPYPLKNRVNAFTRKVLRQHPTLTDDYSSTNAFIRAMAREGRI